MRIKIGYLEEKKVVYITTDELINYEKEENLTPESLKSSFALIKEAEKISPDKTKWFGINKNNLDYFKWHLEIDKTHSAAYSEENDPEYNKKFYEIAKRVFSYIFRQTDDCSFINELDTTEPKYYPFSDKLYEKMREYKILS